MTEAEKLRNEYLQHEISSLQQQLKDARELVRLNKQQLLICYDPKAFDQSSECKAALVLVKYLQDENRLLNEKVEELSRERNLAFDKAFIFEQISETNQRIEQQTIEHLIQTIKELKVKLNQKSQRAEDSTGAIYLEKNIAQPDLLTVNYNNTIQQMNQMLLKYKLQIDELVDQKNDLAQLNFNLSNEILKMKTQRFTPKNQQRSQFSLVSNSEDPAKFINNLVQLQKKLFFDEDSVDERNHMQQSGVFSPLFSPNLPSKVKRKGAPKQEEPEKAVPKLDLTKAQQIQQFNIKRMQILAHRISSEVVEQKIAILQDELIRTKNKYHAQLVLNQQLDLIVTELKVQLQNVLAVNETLVKSNQNYEEKWSNLIQQFNFYKDFYLKFKDAVQHDVGSLTEISSKFQFQTAINSSKGNNKKPSTTNVSNVGMSIINYQDDIVPQSQQRMSTEKMEEEVKSKSNLYKNYLISMAMEVVNLNFDRVELLKPQIEEGQVRIKRSNSNAIEYTTQKNL